MFCVRDQREVAFCTCPDINERMKGVAESPHLYVAPQKVVSYGKRDRPVFPTKIQPCFDPEREIKDMTRVVTRSGSEYIFSSRDGKTFLRKYSPSGTSRIPPIENEIEVTFSEFPIEPGYPLRLRTAGAYDEESGYDSIASTEIIEVDYEYEETA